MTTQKTFEYVIHLKNGNQLPWDGVTPLNLGNEIDHVEEFITRTKLEDSEELSEYMNGWKVKEVRNGRSG